VCVGVWCCMMSNSGLWCCMMSNSGVCWCVVLQGAGGRGGRGGGGGRGDRQRIRGLPADATDISQ
jgi:hypothetical protein